MKYHLLITQLLFVFFFASCSNHVVPDTSSCIENVTAFYPLDGNARDAGCNGLDGNIVNAVPGEDRNGQVGKTFVFNNSSYIQLTNGSLLQSADQDFTIAMWLNINEYSTSYQSVLVSNRLNVPPHTLGTAFSIFGEKQGVDDIGKFGLVIQGGANAKVVLSKTKIELGEWHHVAMTFQYKGDGEKNLIKLFLDGKLDNSASEASDILGDIPGGKLLSTFAGFEPRTGAPAAYHFIGSMDDIYLFDKALSDREIKKLVQ